MPTTVNLLDNTALSIALMNAIADQIPLKSPEWTRLSKSRDPKASGVATIELTINGVKIPDPVKALTTVINREMERLDDLASKRALEMVSEAGLEGVHTVMEGLRDTLREADWGLRRTLTEKAGCVFYDGR